MTGIDPAALTSDEAIERLARYRAAQVGPHASAVFENEEDPTLGVGALAREGARETLEEVAAALVAQGSGGDDTGEVARLRALCAEAARHLRTLPVTSEVADGRMAERLEAASSGSATTDPLPPRVRLLLANVASSGGPHALEARRLLTRHTPVIGGQNAEGPRLPEALPSEAAVVCNEPTKRPEGRRDGD